MNQAEVVVECRPLFADSRSAALRLSFARLRTTARVQLLRLDTGTGPVFSVYVAYREGPMVFEATASLSVPYRRMAPEKMLRNLIDDAAFRDTILLPMFREVDRHFGRLR